MVNQNSTDEGCMNDVNKDIHFDEDEGLSLQAFGVLVKDIIELR